MFNTKFTKTAAIASVCCLSTIAFAGGPDMMHHNHDLYHGGMGVGLNWTRFLGYGAVISHTTDWTAFDFTTNWQHNDREGFKERWVWGMSSSAAMRMRLHMQNLFMRFGGGFGISILQNKPRTEDTPWFVGPLVGVDYQPLRHYMLSGTIYPITYSRDLNRDKTWGFFREGSVSISYIF